MFFFKLVIINLLIISTFLGRKKIISSMDVPKRIRSGQQEQSREYNQNPISKRIRNLAKEKAKDWAKKRGGLPGKAVNIAESLQNAWVKGDNEKKSRSAGDLQIKDYPVVNPTGKGDNDTEFKTKLLTTLNRAVDGLRNPESLKNTKEKGSKEETKNNGIITTFHDEVPALRNQKGKMHYTAPARLSTEEIKNLEINRDGDYKRLDPAQRKQRISSISNKSIPVKNKTLLNRTNESADATPMIRNIQGSQVGNITSQKGNLTNPQNNKDRVSGNNSSRPGKPQVEEIKRQITKKYIPEQKKESIQPKAIKLSRKPVKNTSKERIETKPKADHTVQKINRQVQPKNFTSPRDGDK